MHLVSRQLDPPLFKDAPQNRRLKQNRYGVWLGAPCLGSSHPPARPLPQAHRAPCSPVLLWQTALGGTVRQRSRPSRGGQYPLPAISASFRLLAVQLCRFLEDAVASSSSSARCSLTSLFPCNQTQKMRLLLEEIKSGDSQKIPRSVWFFFPLSTAAAQCYICKSSKTK